MDAVITALTGGSGLTADTFFGTITDLVPFIVMMVPISLALMFLRKLIKGAGRGKVAV